MTLATPTNAISDILFQASPMDTVVDTTVVHSSKSSSATSDSKVETEQPSLGFDDFASSIRTELPAHSALEKVLVERVVLAAWRLHVTSERDVERITLLDKVAPVTPEILRAECSLETAFSLLETARRLSRPRWGYTSEAELTPRSTKQEPVIANDSDTDAMPDLSNEWPILNADSNPRDAFREVNSETIDDQAIEDESDNEPASPRWQDRLVFDFNVSETSPVVKGTWITVRHVVSLIVDGYRWSDILRDHPELTEEDIRTCLAYTIDQDNFGEL